MNHLADRAQRPSSLAPTVAGSVDTPELEVLLQEWRQCYGRPGQKSTRAALIAHLNALIAPAAPSGEAALFARKIDLDRSDERGVLTYRDSEDDWNVALYTHPAPSSPTAPGQQAQAVPEGGGA